MKKIFLLSVILLCLKAEIPKHSNELISVSIAPQAFLVQEITKNDSVNVILPANLNEHNFELKPNSMQKLEKSDIYFTIGLEFEKIFVDKFSQNFKKLTIINSQENIALLEDKEHGHTHFDPHTWLDPVLLKTMSLNIFKALSVKYPLNKAFYEQNLNKLLTKLDELNSKLSSLSKLKNKNFLVYHPSWSYFAKRYKLVQIPVEIEGKEPKAKDLQRLIKLIKEENIKTIFVQKNFPENAVQTLAKECNLEIQTINHLAYDFENELLKIAFTLEKDNE